MRDADALATTKAAIRRNLEVYVSVCLELAAHAQDAAEAGHWRKEGAFGEQAKVRIVARMEQMILYASGEYAPEIAGQVGPGPSVVINAQGDAILANVTGSQGVAIGKDIGQEIDSSS